jgi:pyridoxine 4-dehydrogenase
VGNRMYLRQAAFTSARRLGVERIDLYYLHTPQARDVSFENQIETLAQLQQLGVIRHIGRKTLLPPRSFWNRARSRRSPISFPNEGEY